MHQTAEWSTIKTPNCSVKCGEDVPSLFCVPFCLPSCQVAKKSIPGAFELFYYSGSIIHMPEGLQHAANIYRNGACTAIIQDKGT